ncbi:MAG: UTP--glucose-1-phosphate uridylyltransferase [Nitrospinota bacterium]|nr:UTP--glucose-1-phosphate uridylyltransferase [Nitrospinota bacterium]
MDPLKKFLQPKLPALQGFLDLYERYRQGPSMVDDWASFRGPDPGSLPQYDSLAVPAAAQLRKALKRLVVCKLNGGLGTSMGCSGPKSAVVVRGGHSFLDLIVEQLCSLNREHSASVPLVLMNSFYTDAATDTEKYSGRLTIETFQQNKFPRIDKNTETLLDEGTFGNAAWYPPGHGDFYSAVHQRGLLDQWLDNGRDLLFISNSDNLGATVDPRILSHMEKSGCPFLMEVTPKTVADVKGGTLYQEGDELHLMEFAQVPPEHLDDFCYTEKFRTFNTNNLWINLSCLRERIRQGPMHLPIIVNPKRIEGVEVIQLETAMGAAIGSFPGSMGLVVPRSRHLPVKKTSDLFLVQSDLFILKNGCLSRNPGRRLPELPLINFSSPLTRVEDYQSRIPFPPTLLDLVSLKLEGDVRFGKGVTLKGRVTLISRSKPLVIPENSVLENTQTVQ